MIEGGEVVLRPWDRSDTSFVFDACQDADIQRGLRLASPFSAGDAAAFIERHARPQPEDDGAWFAVTRTDNGELLGGVSYPTIDWAIRTAVIEYWMAIDARRQGFAAAAVDALVRWGFHQLALVEVSVGIEAANAACTAVAARAGFEHDGRDERDVLRYRRAAPRSG